MFQKVSHFQFDISIMAYIHVQFLKNLISFNMHFLHLEIIVFLFSIIVQNKNLEKCIFKFSFPRRKVQIVVFTSWEQSRRSIARSHGSDGIYWVQLCNGQRLFCFSFLLYLYRCATMLCNTTRHVFRSITLERQLSLDSIICEISETCILRCRKTRYVNRPSLLS